MENPGLVSSFSRDFPPEVMAMIVAQMDHPTLKQYSLANHIANYDANRILWRTLRINLGHEVCDALIDNPRRALHVRVLIIALGSDFKDEYMFSSEALTKFANALNCLLGLRTLYIGLSVSHRWDATIAELLGSSKWEFQIKNFVTCLPLDHHFMNFCNGQRELVSLRTEFSSFIYKDAIMALDPDALPCLREISGCPALIVAFVPHRPVTTVEIEGVSRFHDLETISQALSMSSAGVNTLQLFFSNNEGFQASLPSMLRSFKALPILTLDVVYGALNDGPWNNTDIAAVIDEFPALREFSCTLIRDQRAPSLEEVTRYWGRRSTSLRFLTFKVYPPKPGTPPPPDYSSFSRSIGGLWEENPFKES